MLSGRGPQDLSSCVVDQHSEGRPVGVHILAVQRGGFQDVHKTLFGVGVLQLGDVKPFWSLLAYCGVGVMITISLAIPIPLLHFFGGLFRVGRRKTVLVISSSCSSQVWSSRTPLLLQWPAGTCLGRQALAHRGLRPIGYPHLV